MKMAYPNLYYERQLWNKGYLVIGVDEVGRGAFAGPLVLAGVIFKPSASKIIIDGLLCLGINDSKKLTPEKREVLSKIIKKMALSYSFASISVNLINKHGIGKATNIGVRKVVKDLINKTSKLNTKPCLPAGRYYLLMDAFYIKYIKDVGLKHQKAIVHGDAISLSIAAASIIAKVKRDHVMIKLSAKHPAYRWHANKGYGTALHRLVLGKIGATVLHRKDFIDEII